ncbi:unnamed protein product [Rangifer tarandus platyrhynchus]|uniref:Uncharacterized protein n=2 Tax=Rangifer tarandus platyrhynchus TaxID=3082113 RepID=A0ACB0E0T3_RANTA|nr:unnamed protein product [Rangifer tarandus platyrhynchus]CAI9694106.1 unnamed protein product [Rangifer tarandus platyrhynchus]
MLLILLSVAFLALSSVQGSVSESSSEESLGTVLDATSSDSSSDEEFFIRSRGKHRGRRGQPPSPIDENEDEEAPPGPPPPGPPPPGPPPPGPPPPGPPPPRPPPPNDEPQPRPPPPSDEPQPNPPPPEEQPEQSPDEDSPSE